MSDLPDKDYGLALQPDALVPDALVPDALMPDALMPDSLVPDALVRKQSHGSVGNLAVRIIARQEHPSYYTVTYSIDSRIFSYTRQV